MDPIGEVVIGILILVGLAGIVVPILPGLLLEVGAIVLWAGVKGGSTAWSVAIAVLVFGIASQVLSYLVPGRRLRHSGIPNSTLYLAAAVGFAGFFVIPIVGGPIGFVLGIYVAERQRLGAALAMPSTRLALGAVGLSIGIEFTAGLLIAGAWLVAVLWLT